MHKLKLVGFQTRHSISLRMPPPALQGRWRQSVWASISLTALWAVLLVFLSAQAVPAVTDPLGIGRALYPSSLEDDSASVPTPSAAVAPPPVSPATENQTQSPQFFDYAANLNSNVFGANLFTGAFAREGSTRFNPDYTVTVGDQLQVRMWGAVELDSTLVVDPQGNIFLPHVGPVKVLGVRNHDLDEVVESAMRQIYSSNVYGYTSLAAAQPVRVFVGGFVHRPGLYSGTSMDSLLHYLDQAGGIDPDRGSFLNVQVKRGDEVRASLNLYDFLLEGRIPLIQFRDGDVIFVNPRLNTVKVSGLAENPKRFEFSGATLSISSLNAMAKPLAQATHVRVIRNTGIIRNTEYYPLSDTIDVTLQNGDELQFTADKKQGTIAVRVEGEHMSAQEYVLPYGARLGQLLAEIEYTDRSDSDSLQLFRLSVQERQRNMLYTALQSLESSVLTARSATSDEARLRKDEAELILQWVERAKNIEPSGQVLIAQASGLQDLMLENGDIVSIPAKDGLVLVSGEVLFPNAVAFEEGFVFKDYIRRAGGYTQNADNSRVVIAHRDGSFDEASGGGFSSLVEAPISVRPGDEILVLPKIDTKSLQITKEITQILYQIAVSARVVLGVW